VYIATVGKTPEKVLIGLRSRLNIKKVCLVGSSDAEVRQCVESIKSFSERLGYSVETAEANAFDVLDVTTRANELIQRNKNYAVVVNVSSGTRVMTIGALMAAYINNSEAIYVPQQVSEKSPLYVDIPSISELLDKVTLPKKVFTREADVLPELMKRVKEDHPILHTETLQLYIKSLLQNKFEFNAWDTRFERYPRLVRVHEKTETKMVREDVGPYQMVMHFDARCTRCKSWFAFPLKIGVGYLIMTAILSQGKTPPIPQPAPPPFNSQEYVSLMLQSRQDFYCPRCTLLLGLRNVVDRLKKTKMVV
jgi:hypothetical protein